MFRQLLNFLRHQPESRDAHEASPSVNWYDLPDDATLGNEPYDPAKRLRILTTEIDEQGEQFTELYDLQFTASAMTLYMMFANGNYAEMRAECESVDAHQTLVTMAQNIGAFVPCDDTEAKDCSLFRDKYHVYRPELLRPAQGIYIFINPLPNPIAFPAIDELAGPNGHDDDA